MGRIIICKDCGEEKPIYAKDVCKTCYERDYYLKNQEKIKERSRKHNRRYLLATYGLNSQDYKIMLELQGGGCWICGKTPEQLGRSLCVDHNHTTGENRGLLCPDCNLVLGNAYDDPQILAKAKEYLELFDGE